MPRHQLHLDLVHILGHEIPTFLVISLMLALHGSLRILHYILYEISSHKFCSVEVITTRFMIDL